MPSFTQQDHRCSGRAQHALDIVAAQQAEYDSRRLRRLNGETRPLTAAYEDNLRQHLPPVLRFLTSDTHAVDRSVDALDQQLVWSGVGQSCSIPLPTAISPIDIGTVGPGESQVHFSAQLPSSPAR
jgi:hypothetical protein